MRWSISWCAMAVFGGLAMGSLPGLPSGNGGSVSTPETVDLDDDIGDQTDDPDVPAGRPHDEPDAIAEPDPETAAWLDDEHLKPCPDGMRRLGALGPSTHTPFFALPDLAPHGSLDVFHGASHQATHVFGAGDAMRWCQNGSGVPTGPAVISRDHGAERLFVDLQHGLPHGGVRGYSYSRTEGEEHATVVGALEIDGHYRTGEPHAQWKVTCPADHPDAWCPTKASLTATFDRGQRALTWTWREQADGVMTEVTLSYSRGALTGDGQLRRRVGDELCEGRGPVSEAGQEGEWTERCGVGVKRGDPKVTRYKAGQVVEE